MNLKMAKVQLSNGFDVQQPKRKRYASNRQIRKWTQQENKKILQYLKVTNDSWVEKPSSRHYYETMMSTLNIENCNYLLLYHKVRSFYCKYKDALKWKDDPGQMLRTNHGETFFQNMLHKRWPDFDDYEEIWGSTVEVHPHNCPPICLSLPTISGTCSLVEKNELSDEPEMCLEPNMYESFNNDDDIVIIQDSDDTEDSDKSDSKQSTISDLGDATGKLSQTNNNQDCLISPEVKSLDSCNWEIHLEVTKIKEKTLRNKIELKRCYLEHERHRADSELQLRRERFEHEKQMKEREMLLREKEVESTFAIRQRELDLREAEINRDLKMKEMELDAIKWKVEIAKLKAHEA